MKGKARRMQSKSSGKYSWRMLVGVAAAPLLLVGAVSAVSMQGEPAVLKTQVKGRKSDVSNQSGNRHYVTTNAAGQPVVQDRQTGETRGLPPQEEVALAEGLKQLINNTTDGLVQVRHSNGGGVSMDLQGHFQNVSV